MEASNEPDAAILAGRSCLYLRRYARLGTNSTVASGYYTTQARFHEDMTVYVRDFELDAENVKVDKGVGGQVRPGLIELPSKRQRRDPEAQAKKLVDTMSNSLVDDLRKAGYKAQRLDPDDSTPSKGALVTGVFTEVDEGNRMRRALIGFGAGSAKMDFYVTISDLASPQSRSTTWHKRTQAERNLERRSL